MSSVGGRPGAGRWSGRCCLAVLLLGAPASATGAERSLSCREIGDCSDRCGGACPEGIRRLGCLLGCNKQCRRQGCESALPVYDALTACIRKQCLRACMGGPSPECRRCSEGRCPEPKRRCDVHRCPPRPLAEAMTLVAYREDAAPEAAVGPGIGAPQGINRPAPAAAPATAPAATRPATAALVAGTALQPGQRGYKSEAAGASLAVAATLVPVIAGGFATRTHSPAGLWLGLGMIVAGQTFGPTVGFWYVGEPARFTWHRLAVSLAAVGAAAYPFYAYGGHMDHYKGDLAAGLLTATIVLETAAILLAAWDLSAIGEAVERHNHRSPAATSRRPRSARGAAAALVPVVVPGGGGVGLAGWLP